MNDYLATVPFDLYELYLFYLVARHRNFTRAAHEAGITQSAITRQMQNIETRLGLDLLNRTTRQVELTEAGRYLHSESNRLLGDVESTLQHLLEHFGNAPKNIRLGVTRSIEHALLPGFLHSNLRYQPEIACRLSCMSANNILTALEGNELDVGILAMPTRVPRTLRITYSFRDRFCLVAPNNPEYEPPHSKDSRSWKRWVEAQNWLLLDESSSTGRRIGKWLKEHRWQIEPVMQFDNFELILHLVAMGMGVSLVPIRSLALFGRKGNIRRIPLKRSFERELIVLVRKHRKMPDHLKQFVDHILF